MQRGVYIMKKLGLVFIVFTFLLASVAGSVLATTGTPTANYSGKADFTVSPPDPETGIQSVTLTLQPGTSIDSVHYNDLTSCASSSCDPAVFAEVTITGAVTGNCLSDPNSVDFGTALMTVTGANSTIYMQAEVNATLVTDGVTWFLNPWVLDPYDQSSLNLTFGPTSILDTSGSSRFIQEFITILGTNNQAGMTLHLSGISGSICSGLLGINASGVIDGVAPVVAPPAGTRSVGYWKNHIDQRNAFIGTAVSIAVDQLNVFLNDQGLLTIFLEMKGKKIMIEKAKQQLAALLLNVSATLNPATLLSPGELEILQLIDPLADATSNIGDAVYAIEDVIINGGSMEVAKDLADEINNRDHYGN